jgi:hypothetical protein
MKKQLKERKVCTSIYLTKDLYRKMQTRAEKNARSFTKQVEILIRAYLAEDADLDLDEAKAPPPEEDDSGSFGVLRKYSTLVNEEQNENEKVS